MSTWSNIQSVLLESCRAANVAAVVSVATPIWSSTDETIGHVFAGRRGYVGGRNRGRLPFIEVFKSGSQEFRAEARSEEELGGTVVTNWTIRVHHKGITPDVAELAIDSIIPEVLLNVRDTSTDNYMDLGDELVTEILSTPIGFYKDIAGSVEHTYERTTYEG